MPTAPPPQDAALQAVTIIPEGEINEETDCCLICGGTGNLLCCDCCPKAFHLRCLVPPLKDVPEGTWKCPLCCGEKVERKTQTACARCTKPRENSDEVTYCCSCGKWFHANCLSHAEMKAACTYKWKCTECQPLECSLCANPGAEIRCSECDSCFHTACMSHYTDELPAGRESAWSCVECTWGKRQVEQIVGHRRSKHYISLNGEFYVKWAGLSHRHDTWVPEASLQRLNPRKLASYKRRADDFADDRSERDEEDDTEDEDAEEQPDEELELAMHEWIHVDRVVASKNEGGSKMYLVKWRGLNYDLCTWEASKEIANYKEEIARFEEVNRPPPEDAYCRAAKVAERAAESFAELKAQPGYIPFELYQFQFDAVNWLRYSWYHKTNVILADEMGLGKTITTLSFLSTLCHEEGLLGPYLVVAPLSVLHQWERECKIWAPNLNLVMYMGNAAARKTIKEHELYFPGDRHNPKFHILLISYEMALADSSTLAKFSWEMLVVDEGHRLKNNAAKLFSKLFTLRTNYRVLLTGTPLQNSLSELRNMMSFLQVEDLDELHLDSKEIPNEQEVIQKLHSVLRPHMLRRMKADVMMSIPPKAEYIVHVELTARQKELYKAALTKNYQVLQQGKNRVSLINLLSVLQKICNHPDLVHLPPDVPIKHKQEELDRLIAASGKLSLVDKMLRKLQATGHRVLIFSQMVMMLDVLEEYVKLAGFSYLRIDGSIASAERQLVIDTFNKPDSSVFCMLLSTRACRLGINLASADTVITYDSDWNPHNDAQAFSRAHRIGQKSKVMIYRLASKNTMEETVIERAQKKLLLEHIVVRKLRDEFKKGELDEIMRYGAKKLFEESPNDAPIVFDNTAVDKLLERSDSNTVEQNKTADSHEVNDKYFSSFKVARVWAPSPDAEHHEEEKAVAQDYWGSLLKMRYDAQVEKEEQQLGVGKRVKKTVNYFARSHIQFDDEELDMEDKGASESGSSSDDEDFTQAQLDESDEEDAADEAEMDAEEDEEKAQSLQHRRRCRPLLPPPSHLSPSEMQQNQQYQQHHQQQDDATAGIADPGSGSNTRNRDAAAAQKTLPLPTVSATGGATAAVEVAAHSEQQYPRFAELVKRRGPKRTYMLPTGVAARAYVGATRESAKYQSDSPSPGLRDLTLPFGVSSLSPAPAPPPPQLPSSTLTQRAEREILAYTSLINACASGLGHACSSQLHNLYFERAMVHRKLNHIADFASDLLRVIKLKPDFVEPYFHLIELFCKLGQMNDANSLYTHAKVYFAHNQAVLMELAAILNTVVKTSVSPLPQVLQTQQPLQPPPLLRERDAIPLPGAGSPADGMPPQPTDQFREVLKQQQAEQQQQQAQQLLHLNVNAFPKGERQILVQQQQKQQQLREQLLQQQQLQEALLQRQRTIAADISCEKDGWQQRSPSPSINPAVHMFQKRVFHRSRFQVPPSTAVWKERADLLKRKGNDAVQSNQPALAVSLYTEALDFDEANPVLYSNRAVANMLMGQDALAVEDCEHAIQCCPTYAKAFSNMGVALVRLGRYKDAIESALLWAHELQPDNVEVIDALNEAVALWSRSPQGTASSAAVAAATARTPPPPVQQEQLQAPQRQASPAVHTPTQRGSLPSHSQHAGPQQQQQQQHVATPPSQPQRAVSPPQRGTAATTPAPPQPQQLQNPRQPQAQ
eukprot:TRINITY_DN341_c0_g1_i1.p1 TRINITY_DN341_c0_g1~~TRINITY_DN341_c0_g1_i1.p1  ORF type:complete len:1797 (+),score=533.93 TRINITY_DN341_c0_g1_i1:375-5393(+)